jgi:hypothetical protein
MKPKSPTAPDEMRAEYDLDYSTAVRGKYYRRLVKDGTSVVVLEPDVAKAFKSSAAVNRALRSLLQVLEATRPLTARTRQKPRPSGAARPKGERGAARRRPRKELEHRERRVGIRAVPDVDHERRREGSLSGMHGAAKRATPLAEGTMVGAGLTENMIAKGEAVLRCLDRPDFRVTAALWLYKPERARWHFVIASPGVRRQGTRWAYGKIGAAIRSIESSRDVFTLDNVTVTLNTDPLIVSLRKALATGPRKAGVRFTQHLVNGQFIDDAYIYRVR